MNSQSALQRLRCGASLALRRHSALSKSQFRRHPSALPLLQRCCCRDDGRSDLLAGGPSAAAANRLIVRCMSKKEPTEEDPYGSSSSPSFSGMQRATLERPPPPSMPLDVGGAKKGRLWQDPWDLDELMNSRTNFEDLPEWSPQYVSRTSLERIRVHPGGIPTLAELATMPLPPPPPPHPSQHPKAYALHRKRQQYQHVARQVESAVTGPRLSRIQSLRSWEDKQDAVDALYEEVEAELKEKEPILGKHPSFGSWVDRALEEHLRSVVKGSSASDGADISRPLPAAGEGDDETALPVFMDCYDAAKDSESSVVPAVLSPLKVRASEAGGRMVEEWELAAHKASKRILLRQSTRDIARHMIEAEDGGDGSSSSSNGASKRILVHGRQGVGKTAALAAIVASARSSGCIVLYLPDGDNLHRHGFYVEPSARRPGIFDLPVLSQETCQHFLTSHQSDLSQFAASPDVLREFFTGDQLNQLGKVDGGLSLVEILKSGAAKTALAPMCFAVAIDVLTKQDKVPFWMVLDEFNCYFERSHYFHMDYDVDVKKPIPYDQISLLRPALRAMSLSVSGPLDDPPAPLAGPPAAEAIRRGGVLAGTSESRAIGRKVTDGLVENAAMQEAAGAASASSPIRVVEVPRLSSLEVDHVIANYEAVGVGKLRLDRGETVMNEQEMAYLRIVSGGVAQKLMDACIL